MENNEEMPKPEQPIMVMHPVRRLKRETRYIVHEFKDWSPLGLRAIVKNKKTGMECSVPADSAIFIFSGSPITIENMRYYKKSHDNIVTLKE